MVGDSLENDILPARNLGMDAYWLNSDTNTQAAPEGAVLIRSLSELLSH
jgi:FMN phosphatase YigB (HAD superfamily)